LFDEEFYTMKNNTTKHTAQASKKECAEKMKMNVGQLTEQLEAANEMKPKQRRQAYADAVDAARELFPKFDEVAKRHKQTLQNEGHVSPYDTEDRGTFQGVFDQVPGLSKAYGQTVQLERGKQARAELVYAVQDSARSWEL
jgi:hypothetical protein